MTIDEFREICNEVFKYVEDKKGKKKRKGFPQGCSECVNKNDTECFEDCLWPMNYWKYEELKQLWLIAKASNGGLDPNRIESLQIEDYIKLAIMKEYL